MQSIFKDARLVLEGKKYSSDELADLTKILLSLKYSYSDINSVRSDLAKAPDVSDALIKIVSLIAGNTSIFNSLVSSSKNEDVEEAAEDIQESAKVVASVVLWNSKTIKKSFTTQSAAEAWVKKMQDDEDVRGHEMYTESAELELEEAYGESWVVYNKDKAKIPKLFKNRKGAYDYAAKSGGVVYSAEYYFDNQDDIKSGKLVKEELTDDLEEAALLEAELMKKLENDITTLKRIGWNLDRITKHVIISKEYGIKMTSALIQKIFDATGKRGEPIVVKVKTPKVKKEKPYEWPNDPKGSQTKNTAHAEKFVDKVLKDPHGSPDFEYDEMYQVLDNAGYVEKVIDSVLRNLGMEKPSPRQHKTFPKKQARKRL
jgi:hypothetical protein